MRDTFGNDRLFFDAVRDVAGADGIDTLRRDLGGSSVYVPCVRLREASPLAEALGMPAASAIVDRLRVIGADDRALGGFYVYVGAGPHSAREAARSAAVEAVAGGMTRRAAARLVGLSERTVQKAARRAGLAGKVERFADLDAAVVAAYVEHPSGSAMAARLGIDLARFHDVLPRVRRRTGLALALERRPRRREVTRPSRAEATAARDAAVVAAHAEDPTSAGMAVRLGIARQSVRDRIAGVRERTGLALPIDRPTRARPCERPAPRPVAVAVRVQPPPTRPASAPTLSRRDAALIAAQAEGLSPGDVAQRAGLSLSYVYSRFWRLRKWTGQPLAFSRKPAQEQIWGEHNRTRQAQVEACLREGLSRPQIAERLGISLSTVGNFRVKVRAATGQAFVAPPRDHPNTRAGVRHRRAIVEAYTPSITGADLAAVVGLTVPTLRFHLARLSRETGKDFTLARPASVDRLSL